MIDSFVYGRSMFRKWEHTIMSVASFQPHAEAAKTLGLESWDDIFYKQRVMMRNAQIVRYQKVVQNDSGAQ